MKNIHVISTSQPSRLYLNTQEYIFEEEYSLSTDECQNKNIYITSDEEIKEGDWCLYSSKTSSKKIVVKCLRTGSASYWNKNCKKIILATDPELIKDGVQAIDDEFLEWFVKNPSCEEVEVEEDKHLFCKHCNTLHSTHGDGINCDVCRKESQPYLKTLNYKIIIPKDKQLFTDYPITELGDEEFKEAPIRQCELLSYDDNKYCYVKVEGLGKEIKRCYIYPQKGRCGEVNCISVDEIKKLLKEEPKKEYQTCKCGSNWFNTTVADKPFCFKCGESVKEDFKPTEENCTCTDKCLGYLTKTCKGIEETALRLYPNRESFLDRFQDIEREVFIKGYKLAQERMYSEEEVYNIVEQAIKENSNKQLHFFDGGYSNPIYTNLQEWFKQFKKK